MTQLQLLARSKGGLARARNHSHSQIVAWGKLEGKGKRGRPHNLTLSDLRAIEAQEIKK